MIIMKPTCAMTKYMKPPRIDCFVWSKTTRKYEVSDISSKSTRNQNALSESTTSSIEVMNRCM